MANVSRPTWLRLIVPTLHGFESAVTFVTIAIQRIVSVKSHFVFAFNVTVFITAEMRNVGDPDNAGQRNVFVVDEYKDLCQGLTPIIEFRGRSLSFSRARKKAESRLLSACGAVSTLSVESYCMKIGRVSNPHRVSKVGYSLFNDGDVVSRNRCRGDISRKAT